MMVRNALAEMHAERRDLTAAVVGVLLLVVTFGCAAPEPPRAGPSPRDSPPPATADIAAPVGSPRLRLPSPRSPGSRRRTSRRRAGHVRVRHSRSGPRQHSRAIGGKGAGGGESTQRRAPSAPVQAAPPSSKPGTSRARRQAGSAAARPRVARAAAQGHQGHRRADQDHAQESGRRSARPVPGVLPGEAQDGPRRPQAVV